MPDRVRLLDCRQTAKRLSVCERTVCRYGKSGLLDKRHVGPWLVPYTEESTEALLALWKGAA